MKELNRFRELFWDAFHVPALQTEKYLKKFQELEQTNDLIAGPLFAIYERGECNYVFEDNDRFHGIANEEDLFDWLEQLIRQYAEEIDEIKPETEPEETDLKILFYQCDIKMELAELASSIIKERKSTE